MVQGRDILQVIRNFDNFVAIQKLAIKFGQNSVHNSKDIAGIVVVVDVVVLVVLVLVHVVAVDPRNLPLKLG